MALSSPIHAGVDCAASHKPFSYAALDSRLNLVALAEGELDDVVDFLRAHEAITVAINAPSHLNTGVFRRSLDPDRSTPQRLRGADMRLGEHELRERGIAVNGTAGRESACPAWVRLGLALYRALSDHGFGAYPTEACPQQWLETHPHAAFCSLLGRTPLSKPSLEGRMQRQLVLFERGLHIPDPMDLLEEITRHKLLNGMMPSGLIYQPDQLDALVAAYTAWVATAKKSELTRLGVGEEGYIHLPVANLLEFYH
ncbi:MAG TPA: DUF429 domain-containing protein [Anaerolineales bacterium]